jgi:hypothetical protein
VSPNNSCGALGDPYFAASDTLPSVPSSLYGMASPSESCFDRPRLRLRQMKNPMTANNAIASIATAAPMPPAAPGDSPDEDLAAADRVAVADARVCVCVCVGVWVVLLAVCVSVVLELEPVVRELEVLEPVDVDEDSAKYVLRFASAGMEKVSVVGALQLGSPFASAPQQYHFLDVVL